MNDESNIQFKTSIVFTQDKREFHVRDTEIEYVKECIANNPNLNCTELSENQSISNTINARTIILRANPLRELLKNPTNFKVDYEIGINPSGDVTMIRMINFDGDITENQAFRTGKNLMNMKFEPDADAQCIAIGKYSIMLENE